MNGREVNRWAGLGQFPIVFSGMFAIAIVGVFMDMALTFISRTATPWDKNRH
jgi:sulfonate transport system permease protein